jgi:hypothetical protein
MVVSNEGGGSKKFLSGVGFLRSVRWYSDMLRRDRLRSTDGCSVMYSGGCE